MAENIFLVFNEKERKQRSFKKEILLENPKVWLLLRSSNVVVTELLGHVHLSATPWTVAHQDPLSMGFPRHAGVGCHFLLQESSPPRDWTHVSCMGGGFFTTEPRGISHMSTFF